jgi:hypothetical protein
MRRVGKPLTIEPTAEAVGGSGATTGAGTGLDDGRTIGALDVGGSTSVVVLLPGSDFFFGLGVVGGSAGIGAEGGDAFGVGAALDPDSSLLD